MDKYYIYNFDDDEIAQFIKQKNRNSNLQLIACTDKEELLNPNFMKSVNYFLQTTSKYGIQPHDVVFTIPASDADMSPADWQKTKDVSLKLHKRGYDFKVSDYQYLWSLEEVENANAQIEKMADNIREKNFSPLEKLMTAYFDVTKRNYKYEPKTEHFAQSRSVYGVLNNESIVCVGFSALLKAIIEKDGEPNIQLFYNRIDCSEDGVYSDGLHQNLIVRIKDDKYNIDGYYYLDPTWDASKKNYQEYNLNYFLVPLKDIQHIKTKIVPLNKYLPKRPKKSASTKIKKPTTKRQQKQEAILKDNNKYATYHYKSPIFASDFNGEKFTSSAGLTQTFKLDKKYNDTLNENFEIALDLEIMLFEEKNHKQLTIENYLKQNNIHYLPPDDVMALNGLIYRKASLNDCMDHAKRIVTTLRGGEFLSAEKVKQNYLPQVKQCLSELYALDVEERNIELFDAPDSLFDKEFIDQKYDELEVKLSEIDNIMQVVEKYFSENPNAIFNFSDYDNTKTNHRYNNLALKLSTLTDFSEQAIFEKLNKEHTICKRQLSRFNKQFVDNKILRYNDITKQEKDELFNTLVKETAFDYSKPINLMTLTRALTTVLTKTHPNSEPAKINKAVNIIIEENTKKAERHFHSEATNAFSVYNQQKKAFNEQNKSSDLGR